jgi:type VI secretion system secreted protein VgrG
VLFRSSNGKLTASAKQKILATAQGAYLKIEGGNIELHAPKKVEFKAAKKDWTGPASSSTEGLSFPKSKDLYDEQFVIRDDKTQEPIAGAPYRIVDGAGKVLFQGVADDKGQTARLTFGKAEKLKLLWGK